jgi:hypothetical protein
MKEECDMGKEADKLQRSRRTFLKGMAVAGGTTVLVSVAAGGPAMAAAQQAQDQSEIKPDSRGYHVTSHIRTYYDKAGF